MSSFGVIIDACALFPASLRDTLLRAADAGLYRLRLTDDILEEVRRNLVEKEKGMQTVKAQRLIDVVKSQFPEAFVTQYEWLIASMPINDKDRHVLAAAIVSKAQVIVTQNLKDFPSNLLDSFEIEAQSPDDFLVHLFHLDKEYMIKILIEQASELRNPSKTVQELLDTLMQHAPKFVGLIRQKLTKEDMYAWSYSPSPENDANASV